MAIEHTHDWGDGVEYPTPFGHYELLRPFARGGMGEVYLARSGAESFRKYCVLKKLRPELTEDREYVTRFIDEARVVVQLHHANIAQVFDVGRVENEYFLAMEYVAGRDLRTLHERAREMGTPVPPGTVLFMISEVLESLDYAHRRTHPVTGELLNLVHRDVSPQNVLVSFNGEIKLIDFGLAQSSMKIERTQPNIVMGKMAYMAPEHARGDAIDARADLFAAGVMAYELLVGERFYEGMGAHDIWQVVGRGGYRPAKWKTIDSDIRKVLAKALDKDPTRRYESCGKFREAVDVIIQNKFIGTGPQALRELTQTVFQKEIENERSMLQDFEATPTVVHDEKSRSQSVSLLRFDELSKTGEQDAAVEFATDDKTFAELEPHKNGSTMEDALDTQQEIAISPRTPATGVYEQPQALPRASALEHQAQHRPSRKAFILLPILIVGLLAFMAWFALTDEGAAANTKSALLDDKKAIDERALGNKTLDNEKRDDEKVEKAQGGDNKDSQEALERLDHNDKNTEATTENANPKVQENAAENAIEVVAKTSDEKAGDEPAALASIDKTLDKTKKGAATKSRRIRKTKAKDIVLFVAPVMNAKGYKSQGAWPENVRYAVERARVNPTLNNRSKAKALAKAAPRFVTNKTVSKPTLSTQAKWQRIRNQSPACKTNIFGLLQKYGNDKHANVRRAINDCYQKMTQ